MLPTDPASGPRRAAIDVGGPIATDTTWNADLVRVHDDVTVEDGVILTIAAGVRVEFQDDYELAVDGTLRAVGRPDQPIVFTTDEPEHFTIDRSRLGCWGGIRFEGTRATNGPSHLAFCTIEYGKATRTGAGSYPYGGGAIRVVDTSGLVVRNCVLQHNVAEYGGALFLYRNASTVIAGSRIVDNHALMNAGAMYCGYSHPVFVNNTIAGNRIHNDGNPYIETRGVLLFLSKPLVANNIVRGNAPDSLYLHDELWGAKTLYTRYNNVEGWLHGGRNIDADPLFLDRERRFAAGSPCIDAGENAAARPFLSVDLDGQARFADDPSTPDTGAGIRPIVDIGADEH